MTHQQQLSADTIPAALHEYDHWVCWEIIMRDDEPTKRPIDPTTGDAAATTDPETWDTLDTALTGLETYDVDGIGFVFHESDPFVGIDLDTCRDLTDDSVESWALSIITLLGSYTERSPSGTGFHILLEGEVPGDRNRTGNIEMYDTARYFTVTGDRLASSPPSIMRRPKSLTEIYDEHLGESESAPDPSQQQFRPLGRTDTDEETSTPAHEIDLDDQALIEKARSAANGDDFDALWRGSTAGYDSHSEADMALACHLAFWTAGDASRMDDLFRQSKLMRPKWDAPHYADGSTYGQKTIERALTTVTTYYDPEQYTTESTAPPTIDELLDTLDTEDDPTSEHDREQSTSADQLADTTASSPTDAEREMTDPSAAALDQPVADADLATIVAKQQATIDELTQRLAAHQQTIDELHATIETIHARLDKRTAPSTDDTEATGDGTETDSGDTSDV